mmetsp:Transcript_12494/g.17142  ORF Transcript_12494/g.17142 Transcript_12494/m.17142 type:complete len:185 (+) Transcript_12494:46-600(+)
MAAEVSYGHFLDLVEEFNYPSHEVEVDEQTIVEKRSKSVDVDYGIIGKIFKAFERANITQSESVESISSRFSSGSLSSPISRNESLHLLKNPLNAGKALFQALQTLTFQSSDSLVHFPTEQSQTPSQSDMHRNTLLLLPPLIRVFFNAFDSFMQNHPNHLEETNKKSSAEKLAEKDQESFPKFC